MSRWVIQEGPLQLLRSVADLRRQAGLPRAAGMEPGRCSWPQSFSRGWMPSTWGTRERILRPLAWTPGADQVHSTNGLLQRRASRMPLVVVVVVTIFVIFGSNLVNGVAVTSSVVFSHALPTDDEGSAANLPDRHLDSRLVDGQVYARWLYLSITTRRFPFM